MDLSLSAAAEPWQATFAPPKVELPAFTRDELREWFRGGEVAAEDCEKLLASASRVLGALEVAMAEGLHALTQGDRLPQLATRFDDYAREALDMELRTAQSLARLGGGLRTRPLLRDAVRSGRVHLRAAQTVLAVAVGDAEAKWVERAATETVRALEKAVRRGGTEDADDGWVRLRTHLP